MPYVVDLVEAKQKYPQFQFIAAMTPSEQKSAFHVVDESGTHLCLKLISPTSELERVQREVQAMTKLDHPNVVKMVKYHFSSSGGLAEHYVLEEFVAGSDLKKSMTGSSWELKAAVKTVSQIASGLEAMHAHRLVHRDLKPENIRLTPEGNLVIIDLGLARHLAEVDLTATADGGAIGTPLYFAPEQFSGTKRDIDQRTDLFALGVILFELMVGSHPFYQAGDAFSELRDKVCAPRTNFPKLDSAHVPIQLKMLLQKLLARERVDRPARADIVKRILEKIQPGK